MSSDEYFDDELDSAFLKEVDAIEAVHVSPPKSAHLVRTKQQPSRSVIELSDSDPFDAFDFDIADLQAIGETLDTNHVHVGAQPVAGPSSATVRRTVSKGTVQTTLFGEVVQQGAPKSKSSKPPSKAPMERTHSSSRNPFGGRAKKTKRWDHTAFAKSGWKQPASEKNKAKGKARALFDDDDNVHDNEEPVEFEQFPAPFVPVGPPPPMKLQPDLLAAKRWLYPLNQPKRDYQFNIVKHCLFENTLVALPTGLGKTFIAGVLMLNFFNWFPDGKVVFLAPSKPLVAQQIDACHKTCGIPGSHAAELTGETSRAKRLVLWAEKRVFYMTPQTLLSDFTSKNCDPRDIVLIVIDEAHKGTGDYAYAQVMRFMMSKNPHFRVLALTATPGSNPEAVQAIVDCLHISRIEIRDEESLDLRPYLHKKAFEQHIIKMDEDIMKLRDLLVKIMQPLIRQIQNSGAMRGSSDPTMLHSFRCQMALAELRQQKAPQWALSAAGKLQHLARAMGYLLEASTGMCYSTLNKILSGDDDETASKPAASRAAQNKLRKDPAFHTLIQEVEAQKNRGFSLHPKMEKLRVLLVQHFAGNMFDQEEAIGGDTQGSGRADASRVMVFVSFRECVDEVVEVLNRENPLIRATRFIGQGTDKQGRKGIAQREQLEVIKRFKSGEFNVLVSTSIGEEGLDIGEVDMIVCYDAQKTPIRMLQRIGRTGRKRDGVVHILLAEGREERNWDKAKDKYKDVQHFIVRAEELELYGDVERLLPDHIKPECSEIVMEIEEYVRVDRSSRKGSRADGESSPVPKGKKRKRDDDPGRNIPAGACTGFVNVKDLLVKGGARKASTKGRKTLKEFNILAGEDDEEDMEIEAGLFGPRRTVSTSAAPGGPRTKKPKRAKTIASTATDSHEHTKKARKKNIKRVVEPTGSQLDRLGEEDSDDEEIEKGLDMLRKQPRSPSIRESLSPQLQSTPPKRKRKKLSPTANSVIDLTDLSFCDRSEALSLSSSPDQRLKSRSASTSTGSKTADRSSSIILSSSPDQPLKSRSASTLSEAKLASSSPDPLALSPSSRSSPARQHSEEGNMAWLIDDDEEPQFQVVNSSPLSRQGSSFNDDLPSDDNIDPIHNSTACSSSSRTLRSTSPSPSRARIGNRSGSLHADKAMPPPAFVPARLINLSPSLSDEALPEPSFAVRAPGKLVKKRATFDVHDSSSPLAMPPPSQRRLQRERHPSPPAPQAVPTKPKKRKFKDLAEVRKRNPWVVVEATHSGDDRSAGSSDADQADEYDSDFVKDVPDTQASSSYDQTAVYRRSLFTQAPGGATRNPVFANHPVRRGWGAYAHDGPSNARHDPSSSPRHDEEDKYELDSFIVDDEEEIFAASASSEP